MRGEWVGALMVFASDESYVIPVDSAKAVLRYPGLVVGDVDGRLSATVPVFPSDGILSEVKADSVLRVRYCADADEASVCAEAEGACVEGLLEGGTDDARGALTYTLGGIEEARGDTDRAGDFYRRSLRLRPGNATVMARLSGL